ncbi:MAG: hypothetical protein P8Y48_19090, partial [Novosphingobium sp.]
SIAPPDTVNPAPPENDQLKGVSFFFMLPRTSLFTIDRHMPYLQLRRNSEIAADQTENPRMNSAKPLSSRPSAWTSEPTPGIYLSGGTQSFGAAQQAEENLGPGLKLALLIEGSFSLNVDVHAGGIVTAATSSLFVSRDDWRLDHHFPEGMRLHYLTLFLDAGLVT